MISQAIADALSRIEDRSGDLVHIFDAGFEPDDSRLAQRGPNAVPALDGLSLVAPDGAYFVSAGLDGRMVFSRDGAFTFDDGTLRTRDGLPVLGYSGESKTPAPLAADRLDSSLRRVGEARIERDGSLSYERSSVDPRSMQRRSEHVVVGRVALARFPAGTQPVRRNGGGVMAPHGVSPSVGSPGSEGFGFVTPFARACRTTSGGVA